MVPSTLLYNPKAGQYRERRLATVLAVTSVLREAGFQVAAEPTRGKGSAAQQTSDAIDRGSTCIFACGGDGTVHDVLQGIVGTGATLGIVPTGSANALAQELGLPKQPVQAVRGLRPDCFSTLQTTTVWRGDGPPLYSLCMAGAGPDGLLMYRMLTVDRTSAGRWRYYEHALRIFLSHAFTPFSVEVHHANGTRDRHRVVSAMALRIGDLQGIFRGIARGASIQDRTMHVVLVAPPARLTLPLWFLLSWLGLGRLHPGVTTCKALELDFGVVVPLQVDGEWAGRTTATITLNGPPQAVLTPACAVLPG